LDVQEGPCMWIEDMWDGCYVGRWDVLFVRVFVSFWMGQWDVVWDVVVFCFCFWEFLFEAVGCCVGLW
jgi:hypothetical protein